MKEKKNRRRNVNLLLRKDFKSVELLTETSFFLYFRDPPKYGKEKKGDVGKCN